LDHAVNWEAISAIGQIVGAIAVVISLIYVAREIRRNARTERVASMDSLNRWLREVAHRVIVKEVPQAPPPAPIITVKHVRVDENG
jgi:hypothetical protein